MKPINQILCVIAIMYFCSCNQSVVKEPENNDNNKSSSIRNLSPEDSLRKAEYEEAMRSDSNHIIYDTTAYELILAFCKKFPDVANSEFAGTAIKGNFGGAYVIKDLSHQGLVSYFCYDSLSTSEKFFVAYKDTNSLTETGRVYPPIDDHYFYLSKNCFTIPTASQRDTGTIHSFIRGQSGGMTNPGKPVQASTFVDKCDKFKTKFGAATVYIPLALAHHVQMSQLLGQPGCAGVRIFLGYVTTATQKNKIRMVMFAVDSNGRNITGTGKLILERMWP